MYSSPDPTLSSVPPVLLREATPDDAPALTRLLHAAFAEYRGLLVPPTGALDETPEKVRETLATARGTLAYFAESPDTPVGSVFYVPKEDFVYLFRLAVLPAYRRLGVGRALIARVEAWTRESELPRVRLGTRLALPQNIAYYERQGYRVIAERAHPGHTTPTYAVLEKELLP